MEPPVAEEAAPTLRCHRAANVAAWLNYSDCDAGAPLQGATYSKHRPDYRLLSVSLSLFSSFHPPAEAFGPTAAKDGSAGLQL